MSEGRNINKRKVWQFGIAAMLVCIVIPVMIYAVNDNKNSYLQDVEITYLNDKHVYISHESVLNLLNESMGSNIQEIQIGEIDVHAIENILNDHPWVKNAEVYINKNKNLVIELLQNQPIARIYYQNNTTMYYDSTGAEMPVIYVYPMPIPIFTNVPPMTDDYKSQKLKESIIELSKTIVADTFWNAQITQVYINSGLEFDITTIMGDFIVRLGKDDFKNKLHNLYIFYTKGLHQIGWDTYNYIDLRYKNQIVTSPALDYIAPPPSDTMIVIPEYEDTIENDNIIIEKIDTATA